MVEQQQQQQQQYLSQGLPHPDSLSRTPNLPNGTCSSTSASAPPVSTYQDLTPYSASQVSSFNLPPHCDSSLLTPTSTAESPPLHETRSLVHHYPPPPGTPTVQQPTPPGSSKMYHNQWTQFDINGQSNQNSSSMASQRHVPHPEFLQNYVPDGRRTPGPPETYMGAFGVSDNPEPHALSHTTDNQYYLGVHPVDHHSSMMLRDNQSMAMDMQPRNMSTAPLLTEPHPYQFRPQRRPSMEGQSLHGLPEGSRSVTGSPRRRNVSTAGRVKKRPGKSRSARKASADSAVNEHKNCMGVEVAPTLKPSCPEEERCIFESRWRHRNQKGDNMWQSIQNDYDARFGTRPERETLQMKFSRGRPKYIQWLRKDEEILREAWLLVEKERYEMIQAKFFELGGSRNFCLSAGDVEVKVVNDLRLEEGMYMESHPDAHIRRRRKRRSVTPPMEDSDIPISEGLMSVSPHNALEDEVINQVHSRQDIGWDADSPEGNDMVDMQM